MKIFTFIVSLLLLAGFVDATTFNVQYAGASVVHSPVQYISDSCVKGPVNYDVEDSFAFITNLSPSVLNIKVIRLENNMPAGWSTGMCLDICYSPTVDTMSVAIARGASQYILLHCYTFSPLSLSGNVKLKVMNNDDPSEYSLINFYINSDSTLTGIAENKAPVSINVYPNPFTSTAVVNLKNYRLKHGNIPLDLVVYDLLGNAVLSKHDITGDQVVINRNGLPTGVYFYKLMNDGREEAFGRLSIQ